MARFSHLLQPRPRSLKREAGLPRRAGAFFLDVFLIDLLLTGPFRPVLSRRIEWPFTPTQEELAATMVLFLIAYAYFVLFEYLLGQTPGMMLLSTRTNNLPRVWQALTRNCFLIPVFPFVLLWILEPLMILFTGRGILERLSNTRTLYDRRVVV